MSQKSVLALVTVLLGFEGCHTKKDKPPSSGRTGIRQAEKAPHRAAAARPIDATAILMARFACSTDSDCTMSCAYGALNKAWYESNRSSIPDCLDGCTGLGIGSPRCISGSCATIDQNGKPVPGCTRVLPHRFELPMGRKCLGDTDCPKAYRCERPVGHCLRKEPRFGFGRPPAHGPRTVPAARRKR